MSESREDSAVFEQEPGCTTCEIADQETDGFVYDSKYWRVIVSRDQGYLGRCMVIPLRHVAKEGDLTETEALEFHYLKVRLEEAVELAFGARICNWTELGNDAYQFPEPKPHLHHHMRPRYDTPVEFAGLAFADPHWGRMYDLDQRLNVDEVPEGADFKRKVAQAIRLSLLTPP